MPDLNLEPFAYSEHGHRPTPIVFALTGAFVAAVAISQNAPWFFYFPLVLFIAGSLYYMLKNHEAGMRLTPDRWEFRGAGADYSIRIADVSHVSFKPWSQRPATVTIHLRNGEIVVPPPACLPTPEALKPHLVRAGIMVREG